MIHACHLDLRRCKQNEILGRSSDLLFVLNADIGGVDTGKLKAAVAMQVFADLKTRIPGYPYYEYTWKTVFLHSLSEEKRVYSQYSGYYRARVSLLFLFRTSHRKCVLV